MCKNLFEMKTLESLVRKVVKEEIDMALKKHFGSMKWKSEEEMSSKESRSLKLKFINSISLPVFTGARIDSEDSKALRVALLDLSTDQIVHSGPGSSAKVEIVVLEGYFDADVESSNWTPEEFSNNVVRERVGKKPLLYGDTCLKLKEGVGLVGDILFTDNSSWTRSRKFRLGARIMDNVDGVRVREAMSESFVVKDHRGELYKKHHPPSLTDDVWRLEKIGKDGAFHKRLSKEKIHTVRDFLRLLNLNPARLKNIFGGGMSSKMWQVTVEHACTCLIGEALYHYYPPGSQQKKRGVVFNIVGQVTGLFIDCHYNPVHKLSEIEKDECQRLVESAFEHWEDVTSYDNESSVLDPSNSNSGCSSKMSTRMVIDDGFLLPTHSPYSSSSIIDIHGLDDFKFHDIDMDLRLDEPPLGTTTFSCEDGYLQYLNTDDTLQTQNSKFILSQTGAFAQRKWKMLFSVIRFFSVRRIVGKRDKL
ncbi:calmodulin-binding protein 60 A-like isoform X2 [Impatiens glandulifera]|nr:calmodulin-binding protein 60 A-like isoform X2 [Impatiens glandulifera]